MLACVVGLPQWLTGKGFPSPAGPVAIPALCPICSPFITSYLWPEIPASDTDPPCDERDLDPWESWLRPLQVWMVVSFCSKSAGLSPRRDGGGCQGTLHGVKAAPLRLSTSRCCLPSREPHRLLHPTSSTLRADRSEPHRAAGPCSGFGTGNDIIGSVTPPHPRLPASPSEDS